MASTRANVIEVESRITVRESRRDGIQNFDIDNAYPQRTRRAKQNSGRATTCIDVQHRFINGAGLKDANLYKTVVNSDGETLDKIHRKITEDYSLHRGFYVHFNYNGLGEIVSMRHMPFEEMRMGKKNPVSLTVSTYIHHPDWEGETGRFNAELKTEYFSFDPDPDVVANQINQAGGISSYKGQVYFYSAAGKNKYPLSTLDPVIEDVHSDKEAKVARHTGITTNFVPAQLLVTDAFKSDDDRQAFKGSLKKYQGAKNTGKILHVEKENTNQTVELKKVDINDVDKLWLATTAEVKDTIRAITLVPAVLMNETGPNKLQASATEMQDAYVLYNNITSFFRLIFEEFYAMIIPKSIWASSSTQDFSIIPLTYDTGNSSIPLAVQFGVGGTQSLQSFITDPVMKPEQKINALVIVFGLTTKQAEAMVLGTKIAEEVTA